MTREQFLYLLAQFIAQEANNNYEKYAQSSECYRAAGDALVDEALALIE